MNILTSKELGWTVITSKYITSEMKEKKKTFSNNEIEQKVSLL